VPKQLVYQAEKYWETQSLLECSHHLPTRWVSSVVASWPAKATEFHEYGHRMRSLRDSPIVLRVAPSMHVLLPLTWLNMVEIQRKPSDAAEQRQRIA
jgi:hypothetical protein